jgi:outer membrane protein TolC
MVRPMRWVALFAALWTATASAAEPKVVRCPFHVCLQRAFERSPLMHAAVLGVEAFEAKLAEAKTAAYPKFEFTGFVSAVPPVHPGIVSTNALSDFDWGRFGDYTSVGQASFTLAQPIYTFGKIAAIKRLAATGVDVAHATQRVAEDEMRFQLARAFWALVMVREMRDMIDDGKRLLSEQRAKVEQQRDANDERFNQSDYLRLQILTADFEDRVRSVERTRMQALDGVRMAMVEGTDVDIEPQAEFGPPVFTIAPVEAYEGLALANAPRLLAMRQGTRARLLQVEAARANLWPDLLVVARAAYTKTTATDTSATGTLASNPNNTASSGAGLAIRWSLDLFRTLVRVDQAEIDWRQQVQLEAGERDKTRMDVRQLYREMVDAQAMVAVQEKAMKAARGWLSTETQRYEDGFADDMIESQRALESYYTRRVAFLQATYQLHVAVASLSRAVGMDVTQVKQAPP